MNIEKFLNSLNRIKEMLFETENNPIIKKDSTNHK